AGQEMYQTQATATDEGDSEASADGEADDGEAGESEATSDDEDGVVEAEYEIVDEEG
ncbi:MAG: hypothetical protein IH968_00715, partial [Gemmatimonadetes bacterium]|nr:hypothetical protein [Gemmatimonadota bacterium]